MSDSTSSSGASSASSTSASTDASLSSSATGSSSSQGYSSSSSQSRRYISREPLSLTARNVSYEVTTVDPTAVRRGLKKLLPTPTIRKTILEDINIHLEPGHLTAIMGASGAGKTTLLNVLAGRVLPSNVQGELLLNGSPRPEPFDQTGITSYVMQDDVMMETLSIRESLEFSARLRIGSLMSEKEKMMRVDEIIEELGLGQAADTLVGSVLDKGVSGGERKRAAIGVELITQPSVLFLDEPTSGLDSYTAVQVVDLLRDLASNGRTVCCTIHQPSSQLFAKFDNLCLVANGRIAYYGPAVDAVSYFSGIGFPCPTYSNPADYFMTILATGGKNTNRLIKAWEHSDENESNIEEWDNQERGHLPHDISTTGYNSSFFTQFAILTARAWKAYARNPILTKARLGQTLIFALIVGLVFLQVNDTQTGIQDRLGALFFITINQAISSVMGVISTFPVERALFLREHANRMYSLPAYYMGKTLSEFPWQLIFPLLFTSIAYFLIGLQTDFTKYCYHYLATVAVSNVGQSIGLVISAAVGDVSVGLAIAPVSLIPFLLFAGFFVAGDNITVALSWFGYTSFIKYGFNIAAITEFEGLTIGCEARELVQTNNGTLCPITRGEQVLQQRGLDEFSLGANFAFICGLYVIFRVLSLVILMLTARRRN
eukprot:TRINITY_DN3560_c0_g1_i4.p1 TRINITY_DN3560_c0_g1~~TRINITY_DN3560_c0_g1_i4.p1  ORF type:complete len:659 (+),score=111.51 TRINITY_DN3560_c0_g1_i4:69-2045(+)